MFGEAADITNNANNRNNASFYSHINLVFNSLNENQWHLLNEEDLELFEPHPNHAHIRRFTEYSVNLQPNSR